MKTKIQKTEDIVFISIEGNLDLNSVDDLNFFCSKNLTHKKIIFNLRDLNFVGSVGVGAFSKTLEDINKQNQLKICCASSEFEKVFTNEGFVNYETEQEAVLSFK